MTDFLDKVINIAKNAQSDRIINQAAKEKRDRLLPSFTTYQGIDPVDGTDRVAINGETNSGFNLISNASLSVGERVYQRPNQVGGLQRVDARNVEPATSGDISVDVAEYYFGLSYLYFCTAIDPNNQEIILEGDVITDLIIRAFIGGGEITYTLTGNTFTFDWVVMGDFVIEYRRELKKLACVFVYSSINSDPVFTTPFRSIVSSYAAFVCGIKGKDIIGFKDDDANIMFNTAKSLKSKINILFQTNTALRDYMDLSIERVGLDSENINIDEIGSNTIKFTQFPQYGLINTVGGFPPTTDILDFTLKNNKSQKGRIIKKFSNLQLKTLKSNQQLNYTILIAIYDLPYTIDDLPIQSLSSVGYYLYTDLDTDPYNFLDASATDGGLAISGLTGSVSLGSEKRIEVYMTLATRSYFIDFYARYGLIDSERIQTLQEYSLDGDPTVSADQYIDNYPNNSSVGFIVNGSSLSFSWNFKRETGSTWLQV